MGSLRLLNIMKKINILLFSLFCFTITFAQVGMGDWRMHISPNIAHDVVGTDELIYALMENGILEYDLIAKEKTTWTAANYLSDVSPSAIAYHSNTKNLIIGYENGNLDLIKNNRVFNIPAIVQSSVTGIKQIYRVVTDENNAFLATGVGIVVVDLLKKEVKDTYHPFNSNDIISDIVFFQDSIYALTKDALYVGALDNPFLADPGQWIKKTNFPDYSANGEYTELESFQNKLFISYNHEVYNGDTLFQWENNQLSTIQDQIEINGLNRSNNELLVSTAGGVIVFNSSLVVESTIFQYQHGTFPNPNHAFYTGGKFYIADGNSGLVEAQNAYASTQILFEGPRYNTAYRVKWTKNKLVVASGGISGSGPAFSLKGSATLEGNKWQSTIISNQPILNGTNTWDFVSTAINPNDPEEVAYGTFSSMPLVISKNGVVTDTFAFTNSLLEEWGAGWGYLTDLAYDEEGNLWVANSLCNKPLKVLTKEGVWYEFNLGTAVKNRKTLRLIIDNNNVKWLSVEGVGLVAFDHGENIDDASDDRYRVLGTGPSNGNLPSSNVEAIENDFDNNIWVGTPEGMRVLYNSSSVFDASAGDYNFQKLLIEFGENVEIVLGTTHITDIETDGANRRWIGTATSGVFLLSEDGLDVVRNFTSENSSLLDNTILDMAIDQENGEVFMVTNEGLISYRSDASQGDLEYTNVKVFPNPVRPDYYGPITIQGIAYNSDVKVTDISGRLVYQTASNGGTATWDGQTLQGDRAKTGVYLIWTSIDDPDVKGRKVGKVVFIN